MLLVARGVGALKVPWAITYGAPPESLISSVALSAGAFKPSDTTPAVLSLQAGLVRQGPEGAEVHPVSKLDVARTDLLHADTRRHRPSRTS